MSPEEKAPFVDLASKAKKAQSQYGENQNGELIICQNDASADKTHGNNKNIKTIDQMLVIIVF